MPSNIGFEEAAAIPFGGITAWYFLREGGIKSGQKVLVYGASGAVGTYGVQLAKHYGAEVTGVCGPSNLELVRSLGADQVIDYTKQDFTKDGKEYDIIFDAVGKTKFSQCKGALRPGGAYLHTVMMFSQLKAPWYSLTTGKKVVGGGFGLPERIEGLDALKGLVGAGKVRPVIDRRYPLEQIVEAHRYADTGHKKGVVVITVA
jgi:NADPH:quinone reductase-like Zn-dependent oxidoreductase